MTKLTVFMLLALWGICWSAPQNDFDFGGFESVDDDDEGSLVFDDVSSRPGNRPLGGGNDRQPTNGNNNWQRPGNNGFQQPGNNGFQQPGNNGFQQPGNNGFQQPGNNGFQQPGNNGFQQPGNNGFQQPGDGFQQGNSNGFQQPGNNGFQQPGNNGFQQPGNGFQQPGNNQQQGNNQQNQPTPAPGTLRTDVQRCVDQCPTTPEYNPVCGTDSVLYQNPGKLRCSNGCQRRSDIAIAYYGPCNAGNQRG